MEQYVRTKINNQLSNLGWVLTGSVKNVFQEEPRTKKERSLLKGKRPDYVLYSMNIDRVEPLAVIETKSTKNSGLDGAIEQGYNYAYKLNAPIVFATDGVFYKTLHCKTNMPLSLNGEYVDTLIKENIALQFTESDNIDLRPKTIKTSLHSLIQNFKSINEILRKQGLTAGYERFSEFATILFLKLFSEKEKLRNYTKISEIYTWDYLKNLNSAEWINYITKSIFPEIEKIYKDEEIFTQNLRITSTSIFKEIYDKLNPLELTYINEDIKGAAFEYFLANSPSSDKDLGEYFTPRHIVRTMVKLIDPQIGEKIYDPFCGTGGMLIESYRHIEQNMEHTEKNMEKLRTGTLYGRDITTNARIAKMNMILAGDGHNNIKQSDSLSPANLKEVEGKFDVVISNFPFAQTTDWQKYYDIPSNNGDSICLQHCLKALKDGGRMAIVVPEGVMFRDTNDLIKTRNLLLDNCIIENIISLPAGVFEPYTNVATHIIYCTKTKKKQKRIWFFEVKNDGFSLDKLRLELKERNDLDKFLSFRNVLDEDKRKFGFFDVSLGKIKENKSILMARKYRQVITEQDNFVELSKVLTRNKTPIDIQDDIRYKRIKISLYGEGCSLRDNKIGEQIGTKKQFVVRKGQFLLSKIDARNGAFGFVSAELDNAIITGNFWAYDINKNIAEPEYLAYLFSTLKFMKYCSDKSGGVTNRKYLDEDAFLRVKIPLPNVTQQKEILKKIKIQKKIIEQAESEINSIRNSLEKEWR